MDPRHGEPPDDELVARARNGDLDAFGVLVARHQDLVFRVARRITRIDPDGARDLAQDAFLRAFRGLPQFRGDCPFVHWLLRILHNLVINRSQSKVYRLEQKSHSMFDTRPGHENDAPLEPADPTVVAPSVGIERREMRQLVEAALERIPDDFRNAVVLRDVEGLEYEAIAEILSLPIGTVRSRIHRGREALKEMVERALSGNSSRLRVQGGHA